MRKLGPYEHEQVEGFDKLANLETCIDMEATLQHDQIKPTESAPQ